jgi:endogenous inhibitor of DNA gyrase (YacG/DUF329 family)
MDITRNCENCNKEYKKTPSYSVTAWEKRRFCSQLCRKLFSTETVSCKQCTKQFQRKKYLPQNVFCSKECKKIYRTNHPAEYNIFQEGHVGYISTPWLGKKLSVEHIRKKRDSYMSNPIAMEHSRQMGKAHCGPNHHNWKGGISGENAKIRASPEYIAWRNAVYERDYWTCQDCKAKPRRIIAHHLKPFNDYPELRFEVSNGITLCRKCHKHRHEDIGECSRFVKQGG